MVRKRGGGWEKEKERSTLGHRRSFSSFVGFSAFACGSRRSYRVSPGICLTVSGGRSETIVLTNLYASYTSCLFAVSRVKHLI